MSVEKISLRWQNHESSLRGFLRDLRSASWLGDVLLCAGDTEVAAHGLVLAAGSLQLRRMLARGHARSPPCPQQLIHLRGVAGPVLESILTFLYEGEVSVARDQLTAFLAAAEDLQINGLDQYQISEHSESQGFEDLSTVQSHCLDAEDNAEKDIEDSSDVDDPSQPQGAEDFKDESDLEGTSSHVQGNSKVFLEHNQIDAYIEKMTIPSSKGGHKVFCCVICQKVTRQKQEISRHIEASHIETKPFPCSLCGALLKSRRVLHTHLRSHDRAPQSDEEKSFKCSDCDKYFRTLRVLRHHMKLHRSDDETVDVNTTNNDPDTADNKNDFEKDIKTEASEGDPSLKTSYHAQTLNNGKVFLEHGEIDSYVETKCIPSTTMEGGMRTFSCVLCEQVARQKQDIYRHIESAHIETNPFSCDICGALLKTRHVLYNHKRSHKAKPNLHEEPVICTECGKSFRNKIIAKKHMKTHIGVKEYQCNICEKDFLERRDMIVHMKRHNKDFDIICNICGKGFVERRYLKKHMMKKHEEHL